MAIAVIQQFVRGVWFYAATMLNGVTATGNGEWVEVNGKFSVQVSGITTATVQIRGSNQVTKPSDTVHEEALGADITADGITYNSIPVKWAKVRVSAYTAGSISAYLFGVDNG